MSALTFAVAGNGPANKDAIHELLNDWLGFGERDEEGYYTGEGVKYDEIRLILPLTDDHFTAGVAIVHQWSALANLDFTGVISDTNPPTRRDVKGAKGEASDIESGSDVYATLVRLLAEADPADERVLLVLHEDTEPDEHTRTLIEGAFEAGVRTVLNLSYGLAPVDAPAPPAMPELEIELEELEELEQIPADERRQTAPRGIHDERVRGMLASRGALKVAPEILARRPFGAKLRDAVAAGADGPVTITHAITRTTDIDLGRELEGDPVANVFSTLDKLLEYHIAADVVTRMNTAGLTDGPGSPATDALLRVHVILQHLLGVNLDGAREALEAIADEVPPLQVPSAQDEAQPAPSQTRTIENPLPRMRTEWWDEAAGKWRPKGRGRPRKDVTYREVPVDQD